MKNTVIIQLKHYQFLKWNIFLVFLLLNLFLQTGYSQNKKQDELIYQFDTFKKGFEKQHQQFIDKNDSIFIQLLKASWKKVSLLKGDVQSSVKPSQQPLQADTTLMSIELKFDSSTNPSNDLPLSQLEEGLSMDKPFEYAGVSYVKGLNFYGIENSFEVMPSFLPQLKVVSPQSITEFYAGLSKNNDYWKEQVVTLQNMRSKYQLNDWGFFQLSNNAANVFYDTPNERKLLAWFILLKSGYKIKVGYNDELICLLFPSKEKLFSVPYFRDGNEMFYVIDENKNLIREIETYDQNYPTIQKAISFALNTYPLLEGDKISRQVNYKNNKLNLSFNRGILDFLSSYPQCDLKVYFGLGLSPENTKVLDDFLKDKLASKSKLEAIDFLLDFCQFAFLYETDQSQFGKERYLFAEESLYFPANDCEDRTVFLSYLVKRYMGLETIALDFPGHVNLAVNLNEPITGTYINYEGKKYLICDPTYINAKSGMIAPSYMNQRPKIINID